MLAVAFQLDLEFKRFSESCILPECPNLVWMHPTGTLAKNMGCALAGSRSAWGVGVEARRLLR